jgi:hypothetical protein
VVIVVTSIFVAMFLWAMGNNIVNVVEGTREQRATSMVAFFINMACIAGILYLAAV